MTRLLLSILFTASIALLFGCAANEPQNLLTDAEKAAGWQLLFDGKSMNNWHLYNHSKKEGRWKVTADGTLNCDPSNSNSDPADLVSDKTYTNYEFIFEWKQADTGNSGIFINVQEHDTIPFAWATGPEYQLLDTAHPDYHKLDKRSGCLYGFGPQKNPVDPKGHGEWNQSRIKQVNGKVEFYLNGVLTVEQDFTTDEWRQKVATSGFAKFPEFGKNTSGHLALQDWARGISFRNLKIRDL